MARPNKEGLDYFPIAVNIMKEDSVAFVEAKYGIQAFGLLIRLLIRIYRKGYFLKWTEKEQYLFAKEIGIDIKLADEIVSEYISESFFNQTLYQKYQILTSRGIQKRFVKGAERRNKIFVIKEYFLLEPKFAEMNQKVVLHELMSTETATNGYVNHNNNNTMSAENTQCKVKNNASEQP